MKRGIGLCLLILLVLIFIPLTSAVSFDMKSDYKQGETIIAKISGNFLEPILSANVYFFREHVRIPMQFEISKIESNYYLYADLSGKPYGNYSIVIKDVRHMDFTNTTNADITQNFSVNNEKADFLLTPGVVSADKDFSIQIENLINSDITVGVRINQAPGNATGGFFASLFGGGETSGTVASSVTLSSGEVKDIFFHISAFNRGMNNVQLSTANLKYNIPVFNSISEQQQAQERNFELQPEKLNITLSTESNTTRIIYLINTGTESINGIALSVSNSIKSYVFLSNNTINQLKVNESIPIPFTVFSSDKIENFDGSIKAQAENLLAYSQIFLNFKKNYVPSPNETTTNCASVGGRICNSGETCNGNTIESNEGICCLGTCSGKAKNSSSGTIVIVVLVIIIIALVGFFILKRKKKIPSGILDLAKLKK